MRDAENDGENQPALAAIKALLLTGCRRNEVLALPWACFDPKARCIRFEDTKSGPQLRPIGATAAQLLASQLRLEGCSWVFPASRNEERDGPHVATFIRSNRSIVGIFRTDDCRFTWPFRAWNYGALRACA
jgi:integrase